MFIRIAGMPQYAIASETVASKMSFIECLKKILEQQQAVSKSAFKKFDHAGFNENN